MTERERVEEELANVKADLESVHEQFEFDPDSEVYQRYVKAFSQELLDLMRERNGLLILEEWDAT